MAASRLKLVKLEGCIDYERKFKTAKRYFYAIHYRTVAC